MALRFMDSFDYYSTANISSKWQIVGAGGTLTITAAGGRRSSKSLVQTYSLNGTENALVKVLPISGTVAIAGVAIKIGGTPPNGRGALFTFTNNNTSQVTIRVNADLTVSAIQGSVTSAVSLGITTVPLTAGAYTFIEAKVLFSTTVGTVDIRFNNVSVLSLTGLNTAPAGIGTTWNSFILGRYPNAGSSGDSSTVEYDDVYVCDGSGAAPWNDFLGDIRVDACLPTGVGATSGFVPLTGANWQNVDDVTPDGDTTYNSAAAAGVTDTFVVQDSPVPGATIYGIQHNINAKKSDAGVGTIAPVVRHSGVDNVGASIPLITSYTQAVGINPTNPATGVAWVEADFNAAEFGYKRIT